MMKCKDQWHWLPNERKIISIIIIAIIIIKVVVTVITFIIHFGYCVPVTMLSLFIYLILLHSYYNHVKQHNITIFSHNWKK